MNQKGFANISLVILAIIIIGSSIAGYFILRQKPESTNVTPISPTSTTDKRDGAQPTLVPSPTFTPSPDDFYEIIPQDFDLRCLGIGGSGEFVVRTQAEYQRLIDASPDLPPNYFPPCIDYEFPVIDFVQKTLLGKGITGGGCSSEVKKKVLRNDSSREVIYFITTTFIGTCELGIPSNNWVLVPEIPEDYTVKFEANSRSDL